MKKISILLVFVLLIGAIALTACGGSDTQESDSSKEDTTVEEPVAEEPTEEEPAAKETEEDNPLIGTWYYKGNSVEETYVFNSDGTGKYTIVLSGNKVEHNMTYEIASNKFVITFEDDSQQTDEFTIDGNKMTMITETGDEIEYVKQ